MHAIPATDRQIPEHVDTSGLRYLLMRAAARPETRELLARALAASAEDDLVCWLGAREELDLFETHSVGYQGPPFSAMDCAIAARLVVHAWGCRA
jgi:hypothetical protein